ARLLRPPADRRLERLVELGLQLFGRVVVLLDLLDHVFWVLSKCRRAYKKKDERTHPVSIDSGPSWSIQVTFHPPQPTRSQTSPSRRAGSWPPACSLRRAWTMTRTCFAASRACG